jgi:hypothetical protein
MLAGKDWKDFQSCFVKKFTSYLKELPRQRDLHNLELIIDALDEHEQSRWPGEVPFLDHSDKVNHLELKQINY